jgi:dihydroorotase
VIFAVGETLIIPSPIDVHVHLREPGGEIQETIETGSRAAEEGGYQAVIDMPNNPRGNETWMAKQVEEKIRIARRTSHTNIGFYGGVDFRNPAFEEVPHLLPKVMGTKFYMGFTTGNANERTLDDVQEYANHWIGEARKLGLWSPILLHARGQAGAETARYIARQGNPVHWCHISTESEVKEVERLNCDFPELFSSEVTPHHITMTERDADFHFGWNGGRMQPPLGEEADADALLYAYNKGIIKILATDHAPHTEAGKLRAEAENPEGINEAGCSTCYGVSGIEFVLPIMTSLVQRGKTTMERVVDSLYTQPVKTLGIPTNSPALAAKTTLEISPYVLDDSHLVGKSRNTPYLNWTAWGRVLSITRNGREIPLGKDRDDPLPHDEVRIFKAQSRAA